MKHTLGKLLFAGLLLTGHLAGQSYPYYSYTAEGTTPPGLAPGSPASSHALSGFDNVSLFSGKLNFALPLFSAKGRGDAGYTTMLRLDPDWGFRAYKCIGEGCGQPTGYTPIPGWSNLPGAGYAPGVVFGRISYEPIACEQTILSNYALTRFTFIEPDGTEHELRDTQFQGQPLQVLDNPPNCTTSAPAYNRGTVFASYEGEAMTFVTSSNVQENYALLPANPGLFMPLLPTGVLYFADGRRYDIQAGRVVKIHERNGNTVALEYDGLLTTVNEPNRTITFQYAFPSEEVCDVQENQESLLCDKIQIFPAGSQTAFQTIHIYYRDLSATGVTTQTNFELFQGYIDPDGQEVASEYNPPVVTKVRLPNGTYYRFSYNAYGDVTGVTLPTGGRIEYLYDITSAPAQGMVFRRVTERREYDENSNLRLSRGFSYSSFFAGSATTTTVTESTSLPPSYSSMQVARKTVHVFNGLPSYTSTFYSTWPEGRETTTEVRRPDDSLSRRTVQEWQNRVTLPWWTLGANTAPPTDPRLIRATTYLENGTTSSKTEYDYDQYNNVTTTRSFDFGAGTASRYVNRTFETATGYTNTPVHLRRLLKTEWVAGTGGQEASTTFDYDVGTPLSASGAYWEDPGTSYRGNPTATKRQYSGRDVTTSRTYDVLGNVRSLTEPLDSGEGINRVTQYTYACQDSYLATVIDADSHTASYGYSDCSVGKPSSHTDTNGAVYSYIYNDPLLRLTGVSEAGGLGQVDYTYVDTPGAVSLTATRQQDSCSSSADIVAKTDYDGFGRPVKSRTTDDTGDIYVETLYDGFGQVVRRSDPYRQGATPVWAETTYDPLGRPLATQRLDDNSATRLGYLVDKTYVRDPAGKWRMNRTDALGRLVEVVEDPLVDGSATNPIPGYANASGASLATLYTYDGRDNLLSVTQGTQPARVFTYDALGRLSTAYNPESDTTTYAYNDNGNLKTKTDSDSIVASSTWDELNRIKTKSYTGGVSTPAVTYCYDGDTAGSCAGAPTGTIERGNLTMVTNSAITAKYVHADGLRRVTASSQQFGSDPAYAFGYTYNKAGGLETETFSSNRQVKTCYNQAGQPKSVQNPATSLNYASNVEYAAHGGMTSATLGNGIVETWGYTRMQPTSMSAGSLLSATLTYGTSNNNGNVLSRTINDGTATFSQTFGYDPLNRLTSLTESGTGLSQTYAYDPWGNRAVTAGWVPGASLTPQALTAYTTDTNRWTGVGVGYNNRGSQTALPSRAFSYDAEGRLLTAQYSTEPTQQYAYDGEGRRVKKTVNGVETRFVYDAQGRLAAEYGGSSSGLCSTCYLTADHLGSTRLVTNPSGTVVKRYDYVPFGEEIPTGFFNRGSAYSSGSYPAAADNATSLKFSGKERDAETGLDFFQARYFSAAQGRFTSPDPVSGGPGDPQSWNMYAYARNNPLLYTDPDGQTYRICDMGGYCDDNYSDANFDKNLRGTSKNGAIFNNEGNRIGTYQRTSFDDLSGSGNLFFNQMSARRQASNQLIGAFAIGSAAVGTGGALAVNAAGLTAGAGLTTVNLQGAAQATALALPAGAKLAQMIARSGNTQFIGNPQAFLSFARDFVVTAVKQGTYATGDYISKGGSTIYRVGNDFLTVARDGRILLYVKGANAGGVAAKYSQLGGK